MKLQIKNLFFILLLIFTGFQNAKATEWLTPEFKKENISNVTEKLTDKTGLSLLFLGAATSLHFQQFENSAREDWKNHQQMSEDVATAGDFLGSGFATAAIIAGQYYWDANPYHWQSHARAFAWEALSVTVLKYSFGKQRPGGRNNYVSFPSGHTATAFATATSLTYAYGWKAGLISYPLAILVGASRMADDMHWLSDVVAGSFLGVMIGRATYSEPLAPDAAATSVWLPVIDSDSVGVNYYFSY